jgi:hypothetical protein
MCIITQRIYKMKKREERGERGERGHRGMVKRETKRE